MFLVSPAIYEKLLNSLDEDDKKITKNLNISENKSKENDLRPAQIAINKLQENELNSSQFPNFIIKNQEINEENEKNENYLNNAKENFQNISNRPPGIPDNLKMDTDEEVLNDDTSLVMDNKKTLNSHTCPNCSKNFKNNWTLKRHLTNIHMLSADEKNVILNKEVEISPLKNKTTQPKLKKKHKIYSSTPNKEDITENFEDWNESLKSNKKRKNRKINSDNLLSNKNKPETRQTFKNWSKK